MVRENPYTLPTVYPNINLLHDCDTFVTTKKPTLLYYCEPNPTLDWVSIAFPRMSLFCSGSHSL